MSNVLRVSMYLRAQTAQYEKGMRKAGRTTDRASRDFDFMGRRAKMAGADVERLGVGGERMGRRMRTGTRSAAGGLRDLRLRLAETRREMDRTGRAAGRMGAGVKGAIAGMASAAAFSRMGGTMLEMEERLVRLVQNQGGRSEAERRAVTERIYALAQDRNVAVDPREITAAVNAVVERTGDLDLALGQLDDMALAIGATGAQGADVGAVVANARTKFRMTDDEIRTAVADTIAQGKAGAFTFQNLAGGAELLAAASNRIGMTGLEGWREMGAFAQFAMTTTGKAEQAVTAYDAFTRLLNDQRKRDLLLQDLGVDVTIDGTTLRPPRDILGDIVAASGGNIAAVSHIVDSEAQKAISGLFGQGVDKEGNPMSAEEAFAFYDAMRDTRAEAGMIAADAARAAATGAGQLRAARFQREALFRDAFEGPGRDVLTAFAAYQNEILGGLAVAGGAAWAGKQVMGIRERMAARGAGAAGTRAAAAGLAGAGLAGRPVGTMTVGTLIARRSIGGGMGMVGAGAGAAAGAGRGIPGGAKNRLTRGPMALLERGRAAVRELAPGAARRLPFVGTAVGGMAIAAAAAEGGADAAREEAGAVLGGLGGAAAGAALGSVLPGPGTVIGAIVGGIGGDLLARELVDAVLSDDPIADSDQPPPGSISAVARRRAARDRRRSTRPEDAAIEEEIDAILAAPAPGAPARVVNNHNNDNRTITYDHRTITISAAGMSPEELEATIRRVLDDELGHPDPLGTPPPDDPLG